MCLFPSRFDTRREWVCLVYLFYILCNSNNFLFYFSILVSVPDENSPDSDLESHSVPPISPPPDLKLFTPIPHHPNPLPPLSHSSLPFLPSSPPPSSPTSSDPPPRFPRDTYAPPSMNDVSLDVSLDDENLSSVERIYLLCISKETMHRLFSVSVIFFSAPQHQAF